MSKIFYVLNDRNDTSKGYTEVTQEFVKKYIDSFTEGRAYFINLGYAVMETDEAHYKAYYKDLRREKYLREEMQLAGGIISLNAIDSDELDGVGVVVDTSEPFEDRVLREIKKEKLPEAISILSDEEKVLIRQLYFENLSEREVSALTDVPQKTINNRRKRILKKLYDFFQK